MSAAGVRARVAAAWLAIAYEPRVCVINGHLIKSEALGEARPLYRPRAWRARYQAAMASRVCLIGLMCGNQSSVAGGFLYGVASSACVYQAGQSCGIVAAMAAK